MVPTGNSLAVVNDWTPRVTAYAQGPLKRALLDVGAAVIGNPAATRATRELSEELDSWVAALPAVLADPSSDASIRARARKEQVMRHAIAVTQEQRLREATRALFHLTTVLNRTQDIG